MTALCTILQARPLSSLLLVAALGACGGGSHASSSPASSPAEAQTGGTPAAAAASTGTPAQPAPQEYYPMPTPAENTVVVDPRADRHPISPFIYGVNFGSAAQVKRLGLASRRWGGNHTTRYAWDIDVANRAADWYFMNIPEEGGDATTLPRGSAADRFIDETLQGGAQPLVTVPMLGWVPKDREPRWGFSQQKYGGQQQSLQDAGNGRRGDGSAIQGNDPLDTSREVSTDYVLSWLTHINAQFGSASEGGVQFYALDNEVTLWPITHRDVHPQPVTYDELWARTEQYASAIKKYEPAAKLFGPVAWGWCAYFGGSDECGDGPDQRAHGNLPLIPWYLEQVAAYERKTGVRLVDYLTIHYYPQSGSVFSEDESEDTAALRLRSLKSLYDPKYTDPSWINQPIELIPRMKRWIAEHNPSMRLAITEYSFGSQNGPSGALAQAEVLGIFGREGVDFATRWTAPDEGARVEDAFALYRNYDGAGSAVGDQSIRAVSWNVDSVGAYATRGGSLVYVLLFNKDTSARQVTVQVQGGVRGAVSLHGFDPATRLGERGTAQATNDGFSATLPGRSATLAVAELASAP